MTAVSKNTESLTDLDITNALVRRGLWVIEGHSPPKDEMLRYNATTLMTNAEIAEEAVKRGLIVLSKV